MEAESSSAAAGGAAAAASAQRKNLAVAMATKYARATGDLQHSKAGTAHRPVHFATSHRLNNYSTETPGGHVRPTLNFI